MLRHAPRRLAFVVLTFAVCHSCPALAGPNHGGTLVVHDTGLAYTDADPVPPVSPPPAACGEVDAEAPAGTPVVWKVYAAFPIGSSPRLMGLAWGISLTAGVQVVAAGLPHPEQDFAIGQDGWPDTDGGSVGMSFGEVRTTGIVECYWFGGYADAGDVFGTQPHAIGQSVFVDDSIPPHEDLIAGFSDMGFGIAGETDCPLTLDMGACCTDGACMIAVAGECTGPCDLWMGVGTVCVPNPCPATLGACCLVDGSCEMRTCTQCASGGLYQGPGAACEPSPCPPAGACCWITYGTCSIRIENFCTGPNHEYMGDGTVCDPNPCLQPPTGACCRPDGSCYISSEVLCSINTYMGDGTTCDPNPCVGACCFADGGCLVRTADACAGLGGEYQGGATSCDPNPCPPPSPAQRSTWGRMKSRYSGR